MQIKTIKENYNAEIALIILCCRCYIQTADNSSIPLFIQENKIDWKEFYQLTKAHRVRPVVYKILHPFKNIINAECLTELRNFTIFFNAFALSNKRELYRIQNILKQNNIRGKPYKGVDFAETIYGDIGMREFSDNDIIIKASDLEKIVSIMTSEGYQSKSLEFYQKFPKQYMRDYKDILFEKWNGKVREFAFEFHFRTNRYFQGYPHTFEDMLGDNFRSVNNFEPNQYLKLITLSNGLMDFYPHIRSILDLAVTLKKQDRSKIPDADPVLNNFIEYGSIVSSELLHYPGASFTPAGKRADFINYLLKKILGLKRGKRITISKFMYFRIKNADSAGYKMTQLKNYILLFVRPNRDDLMTVKLPYYFLYYFTKPFRIFLKIFQGKFR